MGVARLSRGIPLCLVQEQLQECRQRQDLINIVTIETGKLLVLVLVPNNNILIKMHYRVGIA